jgi:hypothetical protein
MTPIWQWWVVGLIVACAAFQVARRYAPAVVQRAVRGQLARVARRWQWLALADRIEALADSGAACGTGCGSCGGCGSGSADKAVQDAGVAGKDGSTGVTRNSITPEALRRTIVRASPTLPQSL